jgi:beta-N-acetylhexosaminidase
MLLCGLVVAAAVAAAAPALRSPSGPGSVASEQAVASAPAARLSGARTSAAPAARAAAPRPRIRKRLIPYPESRLREMAAYSKRHYGQAESSLAQPGLIVEHYAEAASIDSIYSTFAPDRPDVEYGELPGVCSHYAVGARGEIVRFVPDGIRCRHVVGLNHVAIGIEHVGFSDGQVLGRPAQLRSSLRLTRWLRCRFGLGIKRVIGHAESLSSPFYLELDPDFQGRTHGDFRSGSMRTYRRELSRLGGC